MLMGNFAWHRRRPVTAWLLGGLSAALLLTALRWWQVSGVWKWAPWLLAWLAGVNLVTFACYGWDKRRARLKEARPEVQRVPELALHGLALAGGSPAAFVAMRLFRHKTVKGGFRALFWVIVVAQLVLLIWAAKTLWTEPHH